MIIRKSNFKEVLAAIERKDTVTARKIERALKKHSKEILGGKGFVELTPKEEKILIEDKEEHRANLKKKKPLKKKKSIKSPLKNPLSVRTAKLRGAGLLKPHEWIGGNEFFQVKPKIDKFLERERHGQLRMELNPKKKKRIVKKRKTISKEEMKIKMAKVRAARGKK